MTKKVMTLTEAAAQRVRELMARSEEPVQGLRVALTKKGCNGLSYAVDYAQEKKPFEEVFEDKGVKIFIDSAALMFLIGTEMDYTQSTFSSGFSFKNPNAVSQCGCGESFGV